MVTTDPVYTDRHGNPIKIGDTVEVNYSSSRLYSKRFDPNEVGVIIEHCFKDMHGNNIKRVEIKGSCSSCPLACFYPFELEIINTEIKMND